MSNTELGVVMPYWLDRPWTKLAAQIDETVPALRAILDGQRADIDGPHARAHGFKLRRAQPGASITVAAFGSAMTRVGARRADEVVLNLVTPEHVAVAPSTAGDPAGRSTVEALTRTPRLGSRSRRG